MPGDIRPDLSSRLHVVFVSNASRDALHTLYPTARSSSPRTTYPALRVELDEGPGTPVPDLSQPFLVTVRSIDSRKNKARCITAFARSGLAAQGVRYVLCGSPEPGFDEVRQLAACTSGVMLPYVPDEQLTWLYRNAGD